MIENRNTFIAAVVLLAVSMILTLPFPHEWPLGETLFLKMHIPIRLAGSFHTAGLVTLILLIGGLVLLAKSLKKTRRTLLLIVLLAALFAPAFLVGAYQRTLASGIDAVSYDSNESNCQFEMMDEQTLHGKCSVSFKNHSSETVHFDVAFHELYNFEEDMPMVSLMNEGGPYEVVLEPKDYQQFEFETNIDVSHMKEHIESGEASGVNVVISSGKKHRNL